MHTYLFDNAIAELAEIFNHILYKEHFSKKLQQATIKMILKANKEKLKNPLDYRPISL